MFRYTIFIFQLTLVNAQGDNISFGFNQIKLGLNQQASTLNRFSFTHIGIQLGTSVENFDFGFQHAIPLKVVNQANLPSVFELYVAFDFSPFRRNNRGLFKSLKTDNY